MTTARTIKRYANRKLYDTRDSRYVTLDHIAAMVRAGDDVRVVENTTRADLTTATLAQIIFEEEKKAPRLSVAGLRKIIQGGMPAAAPSSAAPAAGTPVPPAAGSAGSGGIGGAAPEIHHRLTALRDRDGGAHLPRLEALLEHATHALEARVALPLHRRHVVSCCRAAAYLLYARLAAKEDPP